MSSITITEIGILFKLVIENLTSMEYDYSGRLLEVWKTVIDEESKKALIVRNEYDELGPLKTTKLGQKRNPDGSYSSSSSIETLDYNCHPWMA